MIDLKDFEYDELIEYLTSVGEKKFRAEQIFSWLHKGVESYDEMTNLSKATREKLEKETYVSTLKIREKYVSKIDGTVKYLFELPDGKKALLCVIITDLRFVYQVKSAAEWVVVFVHQR